VELGICFIQVIAVGDGAVNCTLVSAAGARPLFPQRGTDAT
jgi:phosphoserine phosphatase